MKARTESIGADYEKAQSKWFMMVVREKERSRKGNESRCQERCTTEHRARQSAACGNGARCVDHRNALHLPSHRTASSAQQSIFTTRKQMTIWFHHPTTFGRMLFACRLKPIRPTICKQAPPRQTSSSILAKRSQKPAQDHHSSKSLP